MNICEHVLGNFKSVNVVFAQNKCRRTYQATFV